MAQFNRDWRMNTTIYCCYLRSVSFRCACQRASNAKQIAKHVVASMGISSRKQFKQDFAPAKKTRNQIERNETKRNRRLKTEKRNGILGRVVAWSLGRVVVVVPEILFEMTPAMRPSRQSTAQLTKMDVRSLAQPVSRLSVFSVVCFEWSFGSVFSQPAHLVT